jgi:hypothetical protein
VPTRPLNSRRWPTFDYYSALTNTGRTLAKLRIVSGHKTLPSRDLWQRGNDRGPFDLETKLSDFRTLKTPAFMPEMKAHG